MIILYTKNGRKCSNAILYDGEESPLEKVGYVYLVESDFGNQMRLTWNEIIMRYHIGPVRDYHDWKQSRRNVLGYTELDPPIRYESNWGSSLAQAGLPGET